MYKSLSEVHFHFFLGDCLGVGLLDDKISACLIL